MADRSIDDRRQPERAQLDGTEAAGESQSGDAEAEGEPQADDAGLAGENPEGGEPHCKLSDSDYAEVMAQIEERKSLERYEEEAGRAPQASTEAPAEKNAASVDATAPAAGEKAAKKGSKLAAPQRLGYAGLVVFITLISVFPAIATDMYMPALSTIRDQFGISEFVATFTINIFFLAFAVGLLVFGTISDKYGRKPVVLGGLAVFTAASAVCALAPNIGVLIVARAFQALGGGAAGAVGTALVKDCFPAEGRERIFVVVQAASSLGPVIAPIIGGWVLTFSDWHMTFWILAGVGIVCIALAFIYDESNPPEMRFKGTLAGNLARLGVVAKNPGFSVFLAVVAIMSAPFMAYITTSSYVYIDFFGLSPQVYSYFFSAASVSMIAAPFLYLLFTRWVNNRQLISITMVIGIVMGVLMLAIGQSSPWAFFFTLLPFLVFSSVLRPGTSNILLSQQEGDTGSASSLINFTCTIAGFLGSMFASLPWPNSVLGIAISIVLFTGITAAVWVFLLKSKIPLKGIKSKL